jgi:hypothetical protein
LLSDPSTGTTAKYDTLSLTYLLSGYSMSSSQNLPLSFGQIPERHQYCKRMPNCMALWTC